MITQAERSESGVELGSTNHELMLVGCLMLVGRSIAELDPRLQREHFRDARCGEMFQAIRDGIASGKLDPAQPLVAEALYRLVSADTRQGGPAKFAEWCLDAWDMACHASHVGYHSARIVDNALAIEAANATEIAKARMTTVIRQGGDPTASILESIQDLQGILDSSSAEKPAITAEDIDALLARDIADGRSQHGLQTGLSAVDETLGMLPAGQVTIVAARPGMGKTAFAVSIASRQLRAGKGVLFFSLEQPQRELYQRFVSQFSKIQFRKLCEQSVFESQLSRQARRELSQLPLLIDDATASHGYNAERLAAQARVLSLRHQVDLVIVDYLQLLTPSSNRVPREQQVAHMSRVVAQLAKTIDVPVLLLCQLNRESEKGQDSQPKLSWLRESGALEQDANQVVFIDRPGMRDGETPKAKAVAHVAKNRHGRTGKADLRYDQELMQFEDAMDAYYEAAPDTNVSYF